MKFTVIDLRFSIGFKVGLKDDDGGKGIMMTCTFFPRDAKLDARGTGVLRAEGFVPKSDRDVRLVFEFVGKATRAATSGIWIAVFVERLTYHNQNSVVLHGKVGNLRGINRTRNMLDHLKWTGNGGSLVAESKPDSLFAVVNSQDSHEFTK